MIRLPIHQRCVRTFRCRYVYSLSSTQRHASPMYLCDSESESSLDPHTVLRWQSLVRPSHCSVKIICCLVCSSAVRCTGLFRLHHFDFWFDFFHFLFTARALRASLKRQLPTESSKDLLNTIIRIKIQVVSRFADFLLTILCPFRFVFGGFRRSIEAIVRRKRLWINVESFKWMPIHEAIHFYFRQNRSIGNREEKSKIIEVPFKIYMWTIWHSLCMLCVAKTSTVSTRSIHNTQKVQRENTAVRHKSRTIRLYRSGAPFAIEHKCERNCIERFFSSKSRHRKHPSLSVSVYYLMNLVNKLQVT